MLALLRLLAAVCLTSALLTCGCGQRRFASENDALRAKVLELETELAALKKRNTELKAELAAAAGSDHALPEEITANIPQVTGIAISRLSHLRDADEDGTPDTLIVYVNPTDGLGRFVQLAGRLSVHAALLPMDGEPRTIVRLALSPDEVRAAYRSGITGTHYTIEAPVSLPEDAGAFAECDVRITYEGGRSSQRLEAHRAIKLR
jgi:hypothetical protein